MSAIPSTADIHQGDRYVSLVPMSLVARFDRFVGAAKQPLRHREAEGLGGLEFDDEPGPGPRLHRGGRSLTLEDAIDLADSATRLVEKIGVVGPKTAGRDAKSAGPDCRASLNI